MTPTDAPEDSIATPWLTVPQAAARVQCGRQFIYDAITKHQLKAVKVGNALRIHVEWVDAWLNAHATVINPEAPGPAIPFAPLKTGTRKRDR